MISEKTPLRITQDATKHVAPYLGSPDSGPFDTCCRCAGDMSAGGIWYGDDVHQVGCYCVDCADIVAFWPCIDGEDHEE